MNQLVTAILLLSYLLSNVSFAQSVLQHEDVTQVKPCFRGIFEEHSSWIDMLKKGNKRKAKTPEELEKRMNMMSELFPAAKFEEYKATLECVTFTYQVDGLSVEGFLVKPKKQQDVPVLIYNRGGNGRYGAMVFGAIFNNIFPVAEQGFAIIGSQYRGAFDKEMVLGKHDEFGGSDVTDVVKLMEFIPNIENVDPKRVGMWGSSRGGMQTFLALQQLPSIKVVATVAGATDLLQELEFRPAMENVYKKRIPNYATNKEQELEKRSVLKWADKLNKSVPILLQHGDQDKRVSVENAKWLAQKLTVLDHPHKLSIYEGEGHGWSLIVKPVATKELTDWFHQHL